MPEIRRFYGIIIRMNVKDHARPHFHVYYGGAIGVIDIKTCRMTRGRLPGRALGLVVEWASKHQRELLPNWRRAQRHVPLRKIAPLE